MNDRYFLSEEPAQSPHTSMTFSGYCTGSGLGLCETPELESGQLREMRNGNTINGTLHL